MENFVKFNINKDRIGPVIGKKGKTKKYLEKEFNCKINVNSETGEIRILGADALNQFVLKNIINAVGLGHNPENAMILMDENYVIDIIDLKDYVRKDRVKKVAGRIIGRNGSSKRAIEEITGCFLSVDDNYVSFIGIYENVHLIREALEMLIKGASHKSFYRYLEKNKVHFL